jgi:hypothetical protein
MTLRMETPMQDETENRMRERTDVLRSANDLTYALSHAFETSCQRSPDEFDEVPPKPPSADWLRQAAERQARWDESEERQRKGFAQAAIDEAERRAFYAAMIERLRLEHQPGLQA